MDSKLPAVEISVSRIASALIVAFLLAGAAMFWRFAHDITVIQGTFQVTQTQYIEINRRLTKIEDLAAEPASLTEIRALRKEMAENQADIKRISSYLSPRRN